MCWGPPRLRRSMIDGRRKKLFQELEEVPLMTMIGGLDVHRQQITFDYVDDENRPSKV